MNMPLSEGFDVSNLSASLLAVVQQVDSDKQEQANKAPIKVHSASIEDGGIISKFNAKYSIDEALRLSGKYTKQSNGIYLFNNSTSGVPGGHVAENGRFYTFHQSDPLCDGFSHDSFDIYRVYVHGGDYRKAVQAAANDVDPEGQRQRRLEHVKTQGTLSPSPPPKNPTGEKFGNLFVDGNFLITVTPRIDYLVHGHIESDCLVTGFGPYGGGKSFVFLDMGCCCATGTPWAGHAVKQGLVFYYCAEGRGGVSRRIRAWSKKHGYPNLSNIHVSKQTISFETEFQHVVDEIITVAAKAGLSPVLMIVDTLSRHLEGDENSSKDMMKFIKLLEKLKEHFPGCSVLVVHHVGNDSEQSHRTRGSSTLPASSDIVLSINKGLITFTKMKDGELPKPIEFKLVPDEIGIDEETGEAITSCVPVYGERSERNKAAEFTRIESVAIRALVEVAAKEKRNANGKYIGCTKAWREHFYSIRLAEDSEVTPEALKKGFQRTVTALKDKGALEQLSTDSILISEEHQERINAAITAGNILNNQSGGQKTLWGH